MGIASELFDALPTSDFPRAIELTGSGSRRPTDGRPSFDLAARVWPRGKPCKGGPSAPASGGYRP